MLYEEGEMDEKSQTIRSDHFIFADFGLACYQQECSGKPGTIYYEDPTIIMADRKPTFDEYSDIYSLGVTFYEILFGRYIEFFPTNEQELFAYYQKANMATETAYSEVPPNSSRAVMFLAIYLMMFPFDIEHRPDLDIIILAIDNKNPKLLYPS